MVSAVVTAVDRVRGTLTWSSASDMSAFFAEKSEEIDRMYRQFSESISRHMYAGDSVVTFEVGQVFAVCPSAIVATSISAAVAVAGISWIIARRNALAGTEEVSTPWLDAFVQWCASLVARLFAPSAPQLTEVTDAR